jgi:hypothetical protein
MAPNRLFLLMRTHVTTKLHIVTRPGQFGGDKQCARPSLFMAKGMLKSKGTAQIMCLTI